MTAVFTFILIGLDEEEGLQQYVLYDQKEARKGPWIINLDDDRKNKYAPPKNLTVHLSKINARIAAQDGK